MASIPPASHILRGASLCYYAVILVFIFMVSTAVRRRYFSPISDIPGPILASITRLHHVFHIFKGRQSDWITNLHDQYGPFVRIAPDEVSVSHPDAPRKLLLSVLDKVSPRSLRGKRPSSHTNRDRPTMQVPYQITDFRTHFPSQVRRRR